LYKYIGKFRSRQHKPQRRFQNGFTPRATFGSCGRRPS
jgi:hypothetical protein